MSPVQTILHPTDFSERSNTAFELACTLARTFGARLVLVHVAPTVVANAVVTIPPEPAATWKSLQEQLANIRSPEPGVHLETHFREGDPGTEIVRLAREIHCDLIVMGTHGRTGLGRLLLGSVAEAVLRRANCPVLTVKNSPLTKLVPVEEEILEVFPAEEPVAVS